jgi:hypothetical protein
MKKIFILFVLASVLTVSFPVMSSERSQSIIKEDTTERLENIKELKQNIRSLKLRLRNFEIAIEEAKKLPASRKTTYNYIKKISEVVTTITLLVITVAAYKNKELTPSPFVKPASVIASVSSAISGLSGMMADLSGNDLELLNNKTKELKAELSATEISLTEESHLLCSQEPSNQMCLNYVQK